VCIFAGLAVLVAMFVYVSSSDRLGPSYSSATSPSSYRYGRGFAAVVVGFLSANVAAVTTATATTRRHQRSLNKTLAAPSLNA